MIIWRGRGILAPVIGILGGGGAYLLHQYLIPTAHPRLSSLLAVWIGAGFVFVFANIFGWTRYREVIDVKSGRRQWVVHRKHSLLFIPLVLWGWLAPLCAVAFTVWFIFDFGSERPPSGLDQAEKTLTHMYFNDIASTGNTARAQALADDFSAQMEVIREMGVEGETTRPFPTCCHISDHGVVFIIQIPDLHNFSEEAQDLMVETAWEAGRRDASELRPKPDRIAVGIRGRVLYEEIRVGTEQHLLAEGRDRSLLKPFFANPEPAAPKDEIVALLPEVNRIVPPCPGPPALALPSAMRDWTSTEGVITRASLVALLPGDIAKLRREDGREFDVVFTRFCDDDVELLKGTQLAPARP